ncbi:hypothetical protein PPTG_21592 [Phytophthora nicotianae INRA-310]|uniref:Uncharacterized protein n=1 Tax=Phytophthora nicotianae (strain INRA-310) TaxID=761204 RepID=W2QZT6_PHYN3|nr:hypothetical protein PPTG_21592 [Phytophthora nicotianae INRA-310]ETN18712.1 hypothetical protein PPTG_21592 [Phytophthora nicotianae INRA-310]
MESQDQRPPEQAVESSPDHSRPLRTRSHPRFSPYSSTTRPLWREEARRGQTVKLLIYEYGADIARAQDLEDFKAAHVVPDTDRAGAPSEGSLGDVAQSLKEAWSTTFQAEDVVWRLWGNHVTTNLDRSTWDAMIQQPPPQQLVHLFRRTLHCVHRYRVVERVDVHVKVGELD